MATFGRGIVRVCTGGEEELNGGARPINQDNKSNSQSNDCHVKDVQLKLTMKPHQVFGALLVIFDIGAGCGKTPARDVALTTYAVKNNTELEARKR